MENIAYIWRIGCEQVHLRLERQHREEGTLVSGDGKEGRPILQATGRCNREGKVRLNQSQISDLFGTSVQNVSYHIINILKDKELDENSVIKDYLITASDGKKYNIICYSLEMILAIGYRVLTIRGVQFRQ